MQVRRFYTSRHGSLTCLHEAVCMPDMGIAGRTAVHVIRPPAV